MLIIGQIIFYSFIIAIPIIAVTLLYRSKEKKERIAWYADKKYIILSILVPKENEKKPAAAEQLFASLHGIFRAENRYQDQISFEIVAKDKYIQFYVSLPNYLQDFVEGQIYAQYPNVEIFEVPDYTKEDFTNKAVASTSLELSKPDVYPIKTFTSFEVDPLAAITGVLSKVEESEQVWLQIVIKPVSDSWQIRGISHVAAMRAGKSSLGEKESFLKSLGSFLLKISSEIFKALFSPSTTAGGGEVKLSGPEEQALKETERKSTKLGFATRIRLVVVGKDKYTAQAKLETVAGAFKQFSTTNLNNFVIKKVNSSATIINTYRKRLFYSNGYILNIEELASLFHLPTKTVETPNIVWAGSKKGEPPSNLPLVNTEDAHDLTVFGKTNFRNSDTPFGIKRRDRSLHMYVIGKTGTGKSTLLENMIIDDIRKGQGVAFIDPHGDAINHIMEYIPKERINDVIYFNPADKDWPIGFNPVESVDPEFKNIVASGVVGIFKKIFGESWGPRLEYILRNALLAAVDYPGSTLLTVMKLLTDKDFRHKVVSEINDPVVKDFFLNEYDRYDPKFQREAIAPIQNKVGQFLSSSIIRNIVGQPKSTIDLYEAMNTGKIFLADLSIGKIGEDNSALLGSMIITKYQLAAMQRTNIPSEKRRDFYLYVDEFQNFATDSFAVILSEARKYRLNLIMTNQYIAQMPEQVAQAIFGNVGTILSFRVGASDASALVREFEPVFTANDLINLNNYNIYVKMAIDGVTRPAFSAVTLNLPEKEPVSIYQEIVEASRKNYANSRIDIEANMKSWNEEIEQSRADEIKRKVLKNQTTILNKEGKGFYTFVDKVGQKWYIPKSTEEDKEKTDEKKNQPNPLQEEQVKKIENKTMQPDEVKSESKSEEKKPVHTMKFEPMIAPELKKDVDKIKSKIVNDQEVSNELLVSMEELEKYLNKDKN